MKKYKAKTSGFNKFCSGTLLPELEKETVNKLTVLRDVTS